MHGREPMSPLFPYTTLFRSDRDRRGESPGVGLGLGDPRPRLNVGVERDGDGRQDADDRDDDHHLDEGEAALVANVQMAFVAKAKHTFLLECSKFPPQLFLPHAAALWRSAAK